MLQRFLVPRIARWLAQSYASMNPSLSLSVCLLHTHEHTRWNLLRCSERTCGDRVWWLVCGGEERGENTRK
uniref:Putative secreted protein n=1 Tax=Anopheles darlingi TaxID=43151 RepID=A0A2M4DRQ9_ANODA